MTRTDIFLLLGSLSLVIIAAIQLVVLFWVKRTLKRAEELFITLNKDVGPLCKSLAATAAELEALSASLNNKMDRTDKIFETAQQAAETLLLTSNTVRNTVRSIICDIGGITAGIQTFSRFFFKSRNKP